MRRLTLALLGLALLSTAAAALAADPVATGVAAPAGLAMTASPAVVNQTLDNSTPAAITPLCPTEPVVTCNSCFLLGTVTSYQCTLFCANGVPHRSCTFCGSGCPL